MQYDQNVLTMTERRIFALRTLFSKYSYSPYRMSKFAEYDLYSRHKDFLVSDRVIAFTDTNGKLKALKPDVTLSLVSNIKDQPDELQKLYYNENVYRVSPRSNRFKEIMQMGLECIGAVDGKCVSEVLKLAAESLNIIAEDEEVVLLVSDQDILTGSVEAMTDSPAVRKELLSLAAEKNLHEIRACCARNDIPEEKQNRLLQLLKLHGTPAEVFPPLEALFASGTSGTSGASDANSANITSDTSNTDGMGGIVRRLKEALAEFEGTEAYRNIRLDFSLVSDTNYYNGITFAGYVSGLPEQIIVGGQYDKLMQMMKKKSRAIGFAVYLDALTRLGRKAGNDSIQYFYDNAGALDSSEEV